MGTLEGWTSPDTSLSMDAHLVTTSFEDRPWLNDMDKKTPIQIAAEKIASAKFRDHGAPGCHLSDESLQAFRSKHGYNNYDPDADKLYAPIFYTLQAVHSRSRPSSSVVSRAPS